MKLQKIRYFIIAVGFFWILCASLIGTLIGAKINTILMQDLNHPWLFGLEKVLLISAHSHLNLMGTLTILIGIILHFLWGQIPKHWLKIILFCDLLSTPFFVCGLLLKAFVQSTSGLFVVSTIITASGAILFVISIVGFTSCFFFLFISKQ